MSARPPGAAWGNSGREKDGRRRVRGRSERKRIIFGYLGMLLRKRSVPAAGIKACLIEENMSVLGSGGTAEGINDGHAMQPMRFTGVRRP